jgi:hypothetical protein
LTGRARTSIRRKAQPRDKQAGREYNKGADLSPKWPNEQKHDCKHGREQGGRQLVARAERSVEQDGAQHRGHRDEANNHAEYTAKPATQALHPRAISRCGGEQSGERGKSEEKSKKARYFSSCGSVELVVCGVKL